MEDILVLLLVILFFSGGFLAFNHLDKLLHKLKEIVYKERKKEINDNDY